MAWDHLSIDKPHLVYIILGGFTSLFMLCSTFIKERMYIGEATVATLCGVIFGPHAANLINPLTWGNTDQITIEFSRIVLVVQCFAVGVELPKYYMEKHWRSVVFLLVPVMTFGWLITSLFIWWMVPALNWLDSLCVAACVTATDPVLASSVVGKGKFAKRVPKHLRDLLSAESGCNDGMAFPFIYLALYIIDYRYEPREVAFHWIVVSVMYECIFGAFYGFMIGYIGRRGIRYAENHDLVDRESFLVFYFVLALFCAGSGSLLGTDDLLVGFAAGVGFSNDGSYTQKTEESHVSNVIDLLLNLAYFVYLGTIIPWEQYNAPAFGLTPWRLVVIAIFVILFRRIPIMMLLKPFIPDITNYREALFAGHFGPIGVGAIFVAILARADLETGHTTPLAELPPADHPHYALIVLIWPIVTFLVISSIMVHGSSIAVFTLGKHINTLTLTMSYTTAHEDGPSWMSRLPRIASQSKSMSKASIASDSEFDLAGDVQYPPNTLGPIGVPGNFLRRMKDDDSTGRIPGRSAGHSSRRRRKHKKEMDFHPGGPISESAIYPVRRPEQGGSKTTSTTLTPEDSEKGKGEGEKEEGEKPIGDVQDDAEMQEILDRGRKTRDEEKEKHKSDAERHPGKTETYIEGDHIIIENEDGEVLSHSRTPKKEQEKRAEASGAAPESETNNTYMNLKKKWGIWMNKDDADGVSSKKKNKKDEPARGPALVYQFGNTVIVEDADGEVVKKYNIPSEKDKSKATGAGEGNAGDVVRHGLARMSTWTGGRRASNAGGTDPEGRNNAEASGSNTGEALSKLGLSSWGFGGKREGDKTVEDEEEDDRRIRFTIGGAGRRLTKADLLAEIAKLDPKARQKIVEDSDALEAMKEMARKDASDSSMGSSRLYASKGSGQLAAGKGVATAVGAKMALDSKRDEDEGGSGESDGESPRRKTGIGRRLSKIDSTPSQEEAGEETAAERRRREQVLRGVKESAETSRANSVSRSRSESHSGYEDEDPVVETAADRRRRAAAGERRERIGGEAAEDEEVGGSGARETAAERRRREAALGLSGGGGRQDSDSEDDGGERVVRGKAKGRAVDQQAQEPVRGRGIRFAEEPVRGRK